METNELQMLEVTNRRRIHPRREPRETVWREGLEGGTDTSLLCIFYRDLQNGGWFLARIYHRLLTACRQQKPDAGTCLSR